MTNFYETVLTVLRSDERFIAEDGTFLRNAVYEAAMKMDAQLIRLLLANDETRTRFFTDIDGVKVLIKVVLLGLSTIVNFCLTAILDTRTKLGWLVKMVICCLFPMK